MILLSILLSVVLLVVFLTTREAQQKEKITVKPSNPYQKFDADKATAIDTEEIYSILAKLELGQSLALSDYQAIEYACQFIDKRYDCADFRMQPLIWMLFKHSSAIEAPTYLRIKNALLGSKFFMDQPGQDSMCLWSENHLLLFSTAEYLIGQLFEDELFTNDQLSGTEHKRIAKERILIWLSQRFEYGFVEWYSNTYYEEDIAPLANLIEFCDDEEITTKAKMIMDLLLFDLATQSYQGHFNSTSGRQYEQGKKSGNDTAMSGVIEKVWGYPSVRSEKGLDQLFIYCTNYDIPAVIKSIGLDSSTQIIKASTGLDLSEFKQEFKHKPELESIMMQWAMESFSNPEVISDTVNYVSKHNLLTNEFLNSFKQIDLSILKKTNLLPLVSKALNPVTNGVAIQRANTYTYKTPHFMLATAQKYHPGEFGDQQHIYSAVLPNNICVFTTHPASPLSADGALGLSPNYWVGNGRNPHSAQDENVNLTLYVIEDKKGFLEQSLLFESHCYFPTSKFDLVEKNERLVIGRVAETFIAVHSLHPCDIRNDELIQKGQITGWVTELSCSDSETFEQFMGRMLEANIEVDDVTRTFSYQSRKAYRVEYQGNFFVDGEKVDTCYPRFDSQYSGQGRNPEKIRIEFGCDSLELDITNNDRNF